MQNSDKQVAFTNRGVQQNSKNDSYLGLIQRYTWRLYLQKEGVNWNLQHSFANVPMHPLAGSRREAIARASKECTQLICCGLPPRSVKIDKGYGDAWHAVPSLREHWKPKYLALEQELCLFIHQRVAMEDCVPPFTDQGIGR